MRSIIREAMLVTLQTIDLRPDLTALLSSNARRENKSIGELVNEAVEFYLEARWSEALDREAVAYGEMHASLWQTIPGKWVAVYEGRVVDQDDDGKTLYLRVRERFGETPVFMCQVSSTPEEEIWVRTPSTGRIEK